ncbi:hypothetical protein OBBRIDRAFT_889765 [Obba rivulosa]|uniref:RRM domain-containing protein n=1 Tax=Obba rivulosa TaxID=1052685 RepID=A0A8E2AXX2_9APHY|nr:hypothetical protein OBBRIDRAFT_889765 [Obba rivulosa]
MPPKFAVKARAWGTRYDTLGSSPPSSPPCLHNSTSTLHSTTIGGSPCSDSRDETNEEKAGEDGDPAKGDKMPHDASVFVGSLPPNVDHGELARLLSEHLSEHAEIKATKVVRDPRGSVCAFVQCKDATAAAQLIHTLQSNPPRHFLGRLLRYEPARAFRTILVSYRIPIQSAAPDLGFSETTRHVPEHHQRPAPHPSAMRIYRPNNCKFATVLYNAEALELDLPTAVVHPADTEDVDDLSGAGILFSPLRFDEKTLRTIAEAFGRVECFAKSTSDAERRSQSCGLTHAITKTSLGRNGGITACERDDNRPCSPDASQSADIDGSTWEVKYEHRDDCVNALATLRRIPYLTVTWAHHSFPHNAGPTAPRSSSSSAFPRYSSYSPNAKQHLHPPRNFSGEYQRLGYTRILPPRTGGLASTPFQTRMPPPSSIFPAHSPKGDGWTFAHSTPLMRASQSPPTSLPLDEQGLPQVGDQARSPSWSEHDFPPLSDKRSMQLLQLSTRVDSRRWGDRDMHDDGIDDLDTTFSSAHSQTSSLSVNPATPRSNTSHLQSRSDGPVQLLHDSRAASRDGGEEQVVDTIPPTPGFTLSPITPLTPKMGENFPRTPSTASSVAAQDTSHSCESRRGVTAPCDTPQSCGMYVTDEGGAREHDPSTIFVGGLEMFGPSAWDESKLQALFERYGDIETIQLVRPLNKRSAFAFVKFKDTDAPARAVLEEHNRVHNGRQIRVQLRDVNPQRSPWRANRDRTRGFPSSPCHKLDGLSANEHRGPMSFEDISTDGRVPLRPVFTGGLSGKLGTELGGNGNPSTHTHPSTEAVASPHSSKPMTMPKWIPSSLEHTQYVTDTVAPNSQSSSTSTGAPVQPYPLTHAGYQVHQPWMHAYHPQYPYPVPFIHSYTQVPMPVAPPGTQLTAEGNSGGANIGAQTYWQPGHLPMFNPMVPYVAYGPPSMASNEQGQGQTANRLETQAPLQPTGFIQGEYGTLVPVYHPEALNQYMSNAAHGQTPPPHSSAPTQPMKAWPQYTFPMYPYPAPVQNVNASQRSWMPSPSPLGIHGAQHPHMHPTPPPVMLPTASSSGSISTASSGLRGPAPHAQQFAPRNTPPPRRYNRRESNQFNAFGPHRINNARTSPTHAGHSGRSTHGPVDGTYNLSERGQ